MSQEPRAKRSESSCENTLLISRDSYTRALEERVAFLESKLVQPDSSTGHNAAPNMSASVWSPQGGQTTPQTTTSGLDNNPVGEIVGLLALSSSEAPAYVGSSSGLSLAANLGEMVQTSVWNQFISRMQPQQPPTTTNNSQSTSNITAGTTPQSGGGCARARDRYKRSDELLPEPPTDEMGTKMISTYLKRLHSRYPFLDRKQIWRLHEERCQLAKKKREDLTRSDRFAIFKLNLVYAIGATMLQLSEKYKYAYTAPEVYPTSTIPDRL